MTGKKFKFEHWNKISLLLVVYDLIVAAMAYCLALWFSYDCNYTQIPRNLLWACASFAPIYGGCCVVVFWRARLYNSLWRFASYNELMRTAFASVVVCLIHVTGSILFVNLFFKTVDQGFTRMPVPYYVVGAGLQFLLVLGIRFSYRLVLMERNKIARPADKTIRVMLVGAGNAGEMILREILRMPEQNMKVCCIIDDNSNKWGRYIENIPIVGGREKIIASAKKYDIQKIFVAIPSASAEDKRAVLNICKETGCELKNLPGIYQMMFGYATLGDLKDVAVEDLLGREPIRVNMGQINRHIQGRVVMVTAVPSGGGL